MKLAGTNEERPRLRGKNHMPGKLRILRCFDDTRPGLGNCEDPVGLKEEVALTVRRVERDELTTFGNEKPDRGKVAVIHPCVHSENELPAVRLDPRRKPVKTLEWLATLIAVIELETLLTDIDSTDGETLAGKLHGAELNGGRRAGQNQHRNADVE
jgi:hypothetical protein